LGFQILENSTIFIEKENMFAIGGVLLYNAILCCELDELYKEAECLETNASECKQSSPGKDKKCICLVGRRICTSLGATTYGRYIIYSNIL
jgi:hypothetical protein